jgi:hypothetical protein
MKRSRIRRWAALRKAILWGAAAGSLSIAPLHAATYTVSNTNDAGAGSLRQALIDANGNPGVDIIQIDPSINGSIVTIGSTLPALTENVVLDGPTASTLTVRFVSLSSMFTGSCGFYKPNGGTLIFVGRNG